MVELIFEAIRVEDVVQPIIDRDVSERGRGGGAKTDAFCFASESAMRCKRGPNPGCEPRWAWVGPRSIKGPF